MTENGIAAFRACIQFIIDFADGVPVPGTDITFLDLLIAFLAMSALAALFGLLFDVGTFSGTEKGSKHDGKST